MKKVNQPESEFKTFVLSKLLNDSWTPVGLTYGQSFEEAANSIGKVVISKKWTGLGTTEAYLEPEPIQKYKLILLPDILSK